MSLVDATADSINTVYAQVVDRLGAANLDATAEEMGIQPVGATRRLPLPGARHGRRLAAGDGRRLRHLRRQRRLSRPVADHQGDHRQRNPPASPGAAAEPGRPDARAGRGGDLRACNRSSCEGPGTAAGDVGSPVAGKTGTTDNSTDAWFIGYTPKLTTAVWMGYASGSKPMLDFRGYSSIQGGHHSRRELWHNYMQAVLSAYPAYQGQFPDRLLVQRPDPDATACRPHSSSPRAGNQPRRPRRPPPRRRPSRDPRPLRASSRDPRQRCPHHADDTTTPDDHSADHQTAVPGRRRPVGQDLVAIYRSVYGAPTSMRRTAGSRGALDGTRRFERWGPGRPRP